MEVKPADRRPLGRTGLQVSPVCIGTSPFASMPALYGYEVAGDRAEATILESLERLGLDRVQLMYLHDPEYHLTFAEATRPKGA